MEAAQNRAAALANEIAHLRGLDLDGLRARWRSLTGHAAPPHVPKTLLLGVLAYRVQAAGRLQELCLLQQRRHCCSLRGVTASVDSTGTSDRLGPRVTASQVGAILCPDSQTARRML